MVKRLAMLMAGLFLVLGGALAQTHVSGTVSAVRTTSLSSVHLLSSTEQMSAQ